MSSLNIVPLDEKHLADAATLVCNRYRMLRQRVPILPTRYGEIPTMLPMLADLVSEASGVAAIQGSRLVGFLLAMVIPDFRGKRTTYSPEWANAADVEDSRHIYEEMYTNLSAGWVADGCLTHLVCLFTDDRAALEGWQWLGFGLVAADGIRDLTAVPGSAAQAGIRRGRSEDIGQVTALIEALRQHLAAAPTFLPYDETDEAEADQAWLADPANAMFLAYRGDQAVACMGLGPASSKACTIIRDEKTTSIVSAFTRESARNGGLATALLNQVLAWARASGYERCAVDWEPMNILATRFWRRHFQQVSYALARHIDG